MKKLFYLLISLTLMTSCVQEEFNIADLNNPSREDVNGNPTDFRQRNITNHNNLLFAQVSLSAVFFRLMSDQATATNNYLGFWWFSDEPRRQISNSTTNEYLNQHNGGPWSWYNGVNLSANQIIQAVEVDNYVFDIDGVDLTIQELASAYFDKGLGLGYLSYIYDKAYIVNHDTDLETLDYSTYTEVLAASIASIKRSIILADQFGNSFSYQTYNETWNLAKFKQIANSYMARFAIGVARTDAEAQNLNYTEIMSYANAGITQNHFPLSVFNNFYNNYQDWSLYTLGDGAGYIPSDIKLQHLMNPTGYPATYPTDATILSAVVTSDPRASYYTYVGSNFGFLNPDRGRHLFSSYRHTRYFNNNNENQNGIPVEIFPKAEIDYIKAECKYRLGDFTGAITQLNSSPRMTVGNQTTSNTAVAVRNALFYENSIELDMANGMATNWSFMRRHDLLQRGTPTSYPIPASELEIIGGDIYTFGSESNADSAGTAAGQNDWTTITLTY